MKTSVAGGSDRKPLLKLIQEETREEKEQSSEGRHGTNFE